MTKSTCNSTSHQCTLQQFVLFLASSTHQNVKKSSKLDHPRTKREILVEESVNFGHELEGAEEVADVGLDLVGAEEVADVGLDLVEESVNFGHELDREEVVFGHGSKRNVPLAFRCETECHACIADVL